MIPRIYCINHHNLTRGRIYSRSSCSPKIIIAFVSLPWHRGDIISDKLRDDGKSNISCHCCTSQRNDPRASLSPNMLTNFVIWKQKLQISMIPWSHTVTNYYEICNWRSYGGPRYNFESNNNTVIQQTGICLGFSPLIGLIVMI